MGKSSASVQLERRSRAGTHLQAHTDHSDLWQLLRSLERAQHETAANTPGFWAELDRDCQLKPGLLREPPSQCSPNPPRAHASLELIQGPSRGTR